MLENLKIQYQNKERYQSLIVHDLRTPVQSIQYGSEIALELVKSLIREN